MPAQSVKQEPRSNPELDSVSIADALFTKTQQRVLGLLFTSPERSFYLTELINRAGVGRGAVSREMSKLLMSGLVLMSDQSNRNLYQANPNSPIYQELCTIAVKTFGIKDVIGKALNSLLGQITYAAIYGSIAKSTDHAGSDIDLLVVSDELGPYELNLPLLEAEADLDRSINHTIYSVEEFNRKKGKSFLKRVMAEPRLVIKDWSL